jgi:hypothetical protein
MEEEFKPSENSKVMHKIAYFGSRKRDCPSNKNRCLPEIEALRKEVSENVQGNEKAQTGEGREKWKLGFF